MITVDLWEFPKFRKEYCNAPGNWISNLRMAGFKSARESRDRNPRFARMSEVDFSWFVIRWT